MADLEDIQVSAWVVPTETPESDGTAAWDKTTLVLVELRSGGQEGLGYTYADVATARFLQEVIVPANLPWQEADLDIQHPVSQWVKWGVKPVSGTLPKDLQASMILPMGRKGPAFLAYPNFKVFIEWNSAFVYSTTAAYFATRLGGAPPVNEEGAKDVVALTTEQVITLQNLLNQQGYTIRGVQKLLATEGRGGAVGAAIPSAAPAAPVPVPGSPIDLSALKTIRDMLVRALEA